PAAVATTCRTLAVGEGCGLDISAPPSSTLPTRRARAPIPVTRRPLRPDRRHGTDERSDLQALAGPCPTGRRQVEPKRVAPDWVPGACRSIRQQVHAVRRQVHAV